MKITHESSEALFTGIQSSFTKALADQAKQFPPWAKEVTSTAGSEVYPFAYIVGSMKEWIGDYTLDTIKLEKATLFNRDFKDALSISRNAIADDQLGAISFMAESLGVRAGNLWINLAEEAITADDNWCDGAKFFGTTRMIGKSKIENKGTAALTAANFLAARTKMRSYKGPDGKSSLKVTPNILLVGPALESTAKSLMEDAFISDGTTTVSNACRGYCTVVVCDAITNNDWYLMCTSGSVPPVIVQKRKVGTLVRYDSDKDECVKKSNNNEYHIHCRGAALKSLPWLIYWSDVA